MTDKDKKPEDEKKEVTQPETSPETPPESPQDVPQSEEKSADENVSAEEKTAAEAVTEDDNAQEEKPPELSEEDKLREENFRLKTQLEAMKIGFAPDVIEDAVVLAENIVKRDGTDISAALAAVAKKYPDWKNDSKGAGSKPGFKVGADVSKKPAHDEDRIRKAFGLKAKN